MIEELEWLKHANETIERLKAENARLAARLVELQGCVGPPTAWSRALRDLLAPTINTLQLVHEWLLLPRQGMPTRQNLDTFVSKELSRLRSITERKP